MITHADIAQLKRLMGELRPLLEAGYPLSDEQVSALQSAATAAQRLRTYAGQYPLALARLWRPHCLPWSGEPNDPRPAGCKREMSLYSSILGEVVASPVRLEGQALQVYELLTHPDARFRAQGMEIMRAISGTPAGRQVATHYAAFEGSGTYVCTTPGCEMQGVPEARSSQRDAIRQLGTPGMVAFLLGGSNRAGKTESVIQLAVAVAAGRQEPWVQAWMALNDIPEHLIPLAPQRVWISALSFNDAREYHRPKLDKYLPAGTERSSWRADNQAEARLPNGGCIVSKAAAQGRDKFQGAAVSLVVLDEEHPEEIFEECMRGTVDTRGLVVTSMTPLKGITWPHEAFIEKPRPGHRTATITGLDNPHISSRAMVQRFGHLPPVKRAARLLGQWGTVEGAVHPDFDPARHVVEPFSIPEDWRRFGGIDFGTRAPFCHLWAALSPDDVLHVYREHYLPGHRIKHHAEAIWAVEGCPDCYPHDEEIGSEAWWEWRSLGYEEQTGCATCQGSGLSEGYLLKRWADPEDLNARLSLNSEYDIPTEPAIKDRRLTFDALLQRFAVRHGSPGIVFHRCCANTIREVRRLKWARTPEQAQTGMTRATRNRLELATTGDDHAHDVLRYLAYGLVVAGYAQGLDDEAG